MFEMFSHKHHKMRKEFYAGGLKEIPRPIVQSLIDLLDSTTINDWICDMNQMRHKVTRMSIWNPGKDDMHIWSPTHIYFKKHEITEINSRIERMIARSLWKSIGGKENEQVSQNAAQVASQVAVEPI